MPTIAEVLKKFHESYRGHRKMTQAEAVQYQLYGCQICKTVDGRLRPGDVITVTKNERSAWNNKTGTIESFEVLHKGLVIMWFMGCNGHLYDCTIEKLCPECLRKVHTFTF